MPAHPKHLLTHKGKTQSVWAWARELKIPPSRIYARIRLGWPVADVLAPVAYVPMPAPSTREIAIPKLTEHHSGQARAVYQGESFYFGKWGTAQAIAAYNEWAAALKSGLSPRPERVSVAELLDRFWAWARSYYVKDGRPTGQMYNVRSAVRIVRECFESLLASDFGPQHLKRVQSQFLKQRGPSGLPWTRQHVNEMVQRVRRIWSWAVGEGLVPVTTWQALEHVAPARKTKVANPEQRKPEGVTWETVKATLPHLPADVAVMVEVHWLAGCRASEICVLRPCDIERHARSWLWRPHQRKTEHLEEEGQELAYWLGPRAVKLLKPLVKKTATAAYVFPGPIGHARRGAKVGRWTKNTYAAAIRTACAAAGVSWSPRQIRKGRATEIMLQQHMSGKDGKSAAQAVCGHTTLKTTERHYLERLELARQVQETIG